MGIVSKLAGGLAFLLISTANAYSIESLEELDQDANKTAVHARTAQVVLNSYYQGVTEALQAVMDDSNRLEFMGRYSACFAGKDVVSRPFVKGLMEGELLRMRRDSIVPPPMWKQPAVLLFLMAAGRSFPCK